ncbi:MAG: hypothetical protein ACE5NG_14685, partial [bacterium]
MKGKLFLVHWNASEAEEYAGRLRSEGWTVEVEAKDGARACKHIKADPPDVVVIYLTRLPSHGRRTGEYLREVKATHNVPIIFVDGKQDAIEKTKAKVPDAIYTTSSQ